MVNLGLKGLIMFQSKSNDTVIHKMICDAQLMEFNEMLLDMHFIIQQLITRSAQGDYKHQTPF